MKSLQVSCSLIFLFFVYFADAQCPGCTQSADASDPRFQKFAQLGLAEVQKKSNSNAEHRLVRILEAKTQVVEGELIKLKLEIEHDEPQGANGSSTKVVQECDVEIWDRPWLNKVETTVKKCENKQ